MFVFCLIVFVCLFVCLKTFLFVFFLIYILWRRGVINDTYHVTWFCLQPNNLNVNKQQEEDDNLDHHPKPPITKPVVGVKKVRSMFLVCWLVHRFRSKADFVILIKTNTQLFFVAFLYFWLLSLLDFYYLWFINGEGGQYWLAGNVFCMLVSRRVSTFLGSSVEKFQNFVWLLTKSFYISRLSSRGISEFLPVPYGQAGSFRTKSTPIHSVTIASSIQSCCIPSTGALPVLVRNVWYHILVIKQWVFL